MCWRNVIVTASLATGAVHAAFENSTRSGSESVNVPFASRPGSETLSVASPALEVTFAAAVAT